MRVMANGEVEKYAAEMKSYSYQPFIIEELVQDYLESQYLFNGVKGFLDGLIEL